MAGLLCEVEILGTYRPLAGPACALQIWETLRNIVQAIRFDKLGVIEKNRTYSPHPSDLRSVLIIRT